MVRASVAAASTLSREYSRLVLEGVRTSMASVPASELGRKLLPPYFHCRPTAATMLASANAAIQRRWCSAQAMTLP